MSDYSPQSSVHSKVFTPNSVVHVSVNYPALGGGLRLELVVQQLKPVNTQVAVWVNYVGKVNAC